MYESKLEHKATTYPFIIKLMKKYSLNQITELISSKVPSEQKKNSCSITGTFTKLTMVIWIYVIKRLEDSIQVWFW